jgi:hypothetical protein
MTVVKWDKEWLDTSVRMIDKEARKNNGHARYSAGSGWRHESVNKLTAGLEEINHAHFAAASVGVLSSNSPVSISVAVVSR